MQATVADVLARLASLAPPRLAEDWDNVGLQVGDPGWPVRRVRVALDPLPETVAAACEDGVDLLITHHPLLLKGVRHIDFGTPFGDLVRRAAEARLALAAAHTNLDSAPGGVNDVLAARLGLVNLRPLVPAAAAGEVKLVVFVPVEAEEAFLEALYATPAGRIGDYTNCSFRSRGTGTFRPGVAAQPYSGVPGAVSHAEELRVETVVRREDLPAVVAALRRAHPYETMAYDAYRLSAADDPRAGLGRVGEFEGPVALRALAADVKQRLALASVRVVGRPDLRVTRAAICSGSGSSLLASFFASGAQVYISGDLRYHDARDAEARGLGLIDIGHFGSERPVVALLAERLRQALDAAGAGVLVDVCGLEKDPFFTV